MKELQENIDQLKKSNEVLEEENQQLKAKIEVSMCLDNLLAHIFAH